MAKERVVIFEGEDKFINPKKTIYDVRSGEANFIADEPPSDIGVKPIDKIGDMPSDGGVRRTPSDLSIPPSDPEPPVDQPIDKPVDKPVDKPIDAKVPVDELPPVKKTEDVTPQEPKLPPVITTFPTIPLGTTGLGVAPSGFGGGAGGGGEAEKKKKPFNWLWLILIGGAALYLLTRKKK